MNQATLIGLIISIIEFGTLLYLAALGELIAEKAGVLNLGVEGMLAFGGMTAFWVGFETGNPWLALLVATAAGAALASIHGIVSVVLGADQVVSGLALTILGLAAAAFLGQDLTSKPVNAQFSDLDLGPLSRIPWIGETILSMSLMSWIALGLGLLTWFVLTRTKYGLQLRAVGESAATADAAGLPVIRTRMIAVMIGGALAGMSGAYLTLKVFGAWRPGRVLIGSLLFGGLLALEPRLQTFGVDFSPILVSMLPFLLTIVVLILLSIRSRNRPSLAPAAIGQSYRREER